MINKLFPNAVVNKPFKASGISNIIQSAANDEILYIKAKSEDQLNQLIDQYLQIDFAGLIVSPFAPKRAGLNYSLLEISKIDEDIKEKTDLFYPLERPLPPIFGVTGTNGKTSCCWMFSEIMRLQKKNVLYLGTMGTFLAGKKMADKVITTTPSLLELRKIYYNHRDNVDYVAIEVSSHALDQRRLGDLQLSVAAWTNFTQDHLDFHKTMDSYFNAKKKIQNISLDNKVILLQEEKEIRTKLEDHVILCEDILEGINLPLNSHHLGQGFILKNLKIALSAAKKMNISLGMINYDEVKLPPGRFEIIENKERLFIVDYAHTPDALEKLLDQVTRTFQNKKSYIVFGCGGDRDRSKRPLMGAVADQSNSKIILTSDNPRTEDPEQILKDISEGIEREHLSIVGRKEAIEKAYRLSSVGDVIVIAGKGHEDYQEINGERHHFSDQEVVRMIND